MFSNLSKVSVSVLAAALLLATSASARALALDDNPISPEARQMSWSQEEFPHNGAPITDGKFHFGYSFTGGLSGFSPSPNFTAANPSTNEMAFCDVIENCLQPGFKSIVAGGIFDFCSVTKFAPCIESFDYAIGDGAWEPAKFLRTTDPSPSAAQIEMTKKNLGFDIDSVMTHMGWRANVLPGLPGSASGPHLFQLPGAANSGGTDFYTLTPFFLAFAENIDGKVQNLRVADFSLTVQPTVVDSTKSGAVINAIQRRAGGGMGNISTAAGYQSPNGATSYIDQTSVGFAAQFPKNLKLRLTLQLTRSLGGWFQGRLEDPAVKVTQVDDSVNRVVLEAKPSVIPIVAAEFDPFDKEKADALQELKRILGNSPAFATWEQMDKGAGGFSMTRWNSYQGLEPLTTFGTFFPNKAMGFASTFEFKRLTDNNQCMSDDTSFQGLLTTNAMVYQAELPHFSGGEISYKVGGVHYDSTGEPFKGTYNFIMRDTVAKCLYGFKGSAPMQGSISVTSSDGAENVAYTNVSDRDGWLKLTAQGFTFSNPTITAKLTQEPDATPTPTARPTPTASASPNPTAKKVTITCVKGKTVKKVTAINAKCPAGYKKK